MRKKEFKFTQAKIKNLPLPASGRVDYHDEETKKLICRVSSTGNKSFVVVKWRGNKLHRVTLGNADEIAVSEVRKLALAALLTINQGGNPTENKKKRLIEKTTLTEILEQYISQRDLKESTVADYRKKLKQGFEPWLDTPIISISEKMILDRQRWITTNKGATTANNTCRVLRLAMNYANALGIIDNVPTLILNKTRAWHKNKRQTGIIPSDKLQSWHEAVCGLNNYKAKIYLLMLLHLGLRSGETLKLEWSNINFSDSKLRLRPDQTKNKLAHSLSIPQHLLAKIQTLHELTGKSKWVFSGANIKKNMSPPKNPIKKVREISGVHFTPHDLRRTFATIAEAVGISLTMIKRLLNHVTTNDVTGGYIITEEETLKDAMCKINSYIIDRVNRDKAIDQSI
jgi:integrase